MATIYPRYVNDKDELYNAVNDNRTVIILTDISLIPDLKKKIEKEMREIKSDKGKIKGGSLTAVGGTIAAILTASSSFAIAPLIVAAGGIFAISNGLVNRISSTLFNALKNYKYIETSNENQLILVKYKGTNAFNEKEDEIEFGTTKEGDV